MCVSVIDFRCARYGRQRIGAVWKTKCVGSELPNWGGQHYCGGTGMLGLLETETLGNSGEYLFLVSSMPTCFVLRFVFVSVFPPNM